MKNLLAVILLCFSSYSANAALILEGNFKTVFPTYDEFTGSFTILFDDSVLTGVRDEFFFNQTLDSVSFSPNPLLGLEYTISNVFINLFYDEGSLSGINLGVSEAGFGSEFNGDFAVNFNPTSLIATSAFIATGFNQGEDGDIIESSLSIRSVQVSAPATLNIFGLGIAGLVLFRRWLSLRNEPNKEL